MAAFRSVRTRIIGFFPLINNHKHREMGVAMPLILTRPFRPLLSRSPGRETTSSAEHVDLGVRWLSRPFPLI